MSQFLPRSLSQVNEAELQRMADGEREDDYVRAVALLTGNKDVVEKLGGEGGVSIKVGQVGKAKAVKFRDLVIEDAEKDATNGDDSNAVEGDSTTDDSEGEEGDDTDEESPRFVKIPMTPEQLEARKLAKREQRKKNKEEVKALQASKRKTKMKKKDKKRQISKTKGKKR